jgi:CBS domain-containing protein
MIAGAIMRTAILTVTPETGCVSALRLLAEKGHEHAVVLLEGALIGTVSEIALRRARPETLVGAVMLTPASCVSPGIECNDIVYMMSNGAPRIDFLPVVADCFLVGVISRADLVSHGLMSAPRVTADVDRSAPAAN